MKRIMVILPLATIAAVSLLSQPAQAQTNLLSNPGFETGDFSDWETEGSTNVFNFPNDAFRSGSFGAFIGNDFALGTGEITQSFLIPSGNALEFQAYIRLVTLESPVGQNNFDLAQVTLEVPSAHLSKTLSLDVDTVSSLFAFNPDTGFYRTDWILFQDTLDISGLAGESAWLKINFQNKSSPISGIVIDDTFVQSVQSVPESSPIKGLAVLSLGWLLRILRKKQFLNKTR
ncbi:MAG: hypothetical protein ACKPH1_19910 [Microcystis panniformis]